MDFRDIVRLALDEYFEKLAVALEGLSPEERRYQPAPGASHIDFLVWHIARVEDIWGPRFGRLPELWQQEEWSRRLGMPADDSGYGYDAQRVADLPRFDPDEMAEYHRAVCDDTMRYLDGLSREDLALCPNPVDNPGWTPANMLSHLIVEESPHVGQVAYLRGLVRGMNG